MFALLYPPLDIKLFIKSQTNILQRSKSQFEVKYLPVREFHVFLAFQMCQKVPKRGFALTWSKRVSCPVFYANTRLRVTDAKREVHEALLGSTSHRFSRRPHVRKPQKQGLFHP